MPFYNDCRFELEKQIEECELHFDRRWNHIEMAAQFFITHVLVKEPEKRMNTKEMLKHNWLAPILERELEEER